MLHLLRLTLHCHIEQNRIPNTRREWHLVKNVLLFIYRSEHYKSGRSVTYSGKRRIRMGSDRWLRNIIKTMLITIVIRKHFHSDTFLKTFHGLSHLIEGWEELDRSLGSGQGIHLCCATECRIKSPEQNRWMGVVGFWRELTRCRKAPGKMTHPF